MFNNIKLTLKEDILEYKTDISNTNFIYTSIDSIICISNHLFIVLKNRKSILIPKTAFKNNEEINNFIEFLKAKTNITVMNNFPDDINFI